MTRFTTGTQQPLQSCAALMVFDGICRCENDRSALTATSYVSLNVFAASREALTDLPLQLPEILIKTKQL